MEETATFEITMTRADYDALLLMMAIATMTAFTAEMDKLANTFVEIANQVNRSHPHWKPYWIPPGNRLDRLALDKFLSRMREEYQKLCPEVACSR